MIDPLALTTEMVDFADRLGSHGTVRERTRRLYEAILDTELKVRYNENMMRSTRPNGCKTAQAVFEERGTDGERFGMCIEYTLLFMAVGRRMGLHTAAMREESTLGETDGFVFGHIVAAVLDGDEWRMVDLTNRRFWRETTGYQRMADHTLEAYFFNNCGLIFKAQGRLPEADAAISEALAREACHGAFWYNRGCVRLVSGNLIDAEGDLGLASMLVPGSAVVLTNLAVAQNRLGQKANARVTLYLARELTPQDARIAFNLGVLAYEEDDYETAVIHWRDTVSIDPDYPQARNYLGRTLRALGHNDEGLRVLAGLAA